MRKNQIIEDGLLLFGSGIVQACIVVLFLRKNRNQVTETERGSAGSLEKGLPALFFKTKKFACRLNH